MTKYHHTTREGWLVAATEALDKEFFAGRDTELPAIRVSCGFPKATGHRAIGQCWDGDVSGDKTYEIFICPTQAEPLRVADILLHEMIHAAVGIEEGHRGKFRAMAKSFGLAGKMTATYAEQGSELEATLLRVLEPLGEYPHAPLNPRQRRVKKPNPWVRYMSVNDDTFKVVVNENRVDEFGPPKDPWGDDMVPASTD